MPTAPSLERTRQMKLSSSRSISSVSIITGVGKSCRFSTGSFRICVELRVFRVRESCRCGRCARCGWGARHTREARRLRRPRAHRREIRDGSFSWALLYTRAPLARTAQLPTWGLKGRDRVGYARRAVVLASSCQPGDVRPHRCAVQRHRAVAADYLLRVSTNQAAQPFHRLPYTVPQPDRRPADHHADSHDGSIGPPRLQILEVPAHLTCAQRNRQSSAFPECLDALYRTKFFASLTAGAAIATLLLAPMIAAAQDVTEPALKAAFIYNFAKFTEWPADVMACRRAISPVCARRCSHRRGTGASGQGPNIIGPRHGRVSGGGRRAAAGRMPRPVPLGRDSESSGETRCRAA